MEIDNWSTTADSNSSVASINIAEGCPAKNMNNAVRAVMAGVKEYANDADSRIAAEATARATAVNTESTTRATADTALSSRLTTAESDISAINAAIETYGLSVKNGQIFITYTVGED